MSSLLKADITQYSRHFAFVPNPEVATKSSSMRHRRRSSRKANSEALDKARNAAHVHVELIACAERREPLRIGGR